MNIAAKNKTKTVQLVFSSQQCCYRAALVNPHNINIDITEFNVHIKKNMNRFTIIRIDTDKKQANPFKNNIYHCY